ncbi:acyltransferase family protein [Nocardioides sp.]|uniref:acyltransferase family protein n=1 Tax=Nocardioides sp. TaxID=35761 RepID=UPI0035644D24
MASRAYWPALDGLRSIAVYLVLLFHSGVAWFDGGFIGVDLFFVLSGFLVSTILLDELHETGRLDVWRFYARRVRRLLPAALVVIVTTALVFPLVAPLLRRLTWAGDAQAALLYVANWRFLLQSNEYFGADVDLSPYLHFWSLSIEEQFYVVFPLLLVGLFWLRRRWAPALLVGVVAITVLSLAAQLYWAPRDLNHAYYGTDTRLYQLMAGVLAALLWRRWREAPPSLRGAGWAALAALLAISTALVPVTPSVRGILATLASVSLVLALMTRADGGLDRLLSGRGITYLGRISYGTYLWHWPVILLLTEILDTSSWVIALLASGVATGLAAASFELVEHPFRRSPRLTPFPVPVLLTGLTVSAVIAFTLAPSALNSERRPSLVASASGQPVSGTELNVDRPIPADIDWPGLASDNGGEDLACRLSSLDTCVVHRGDSGLTVMLAGDSESRMLRRTMTRLAQEHDFTLALSIVGGCPWQQGVQSLYDTAAERERCASARRDLYEGVLQELEVDVIVLNQVARDKGAWETNLTRLDGTTPGLAELNLTTINQTLATIEEAGAQAVIVETPLIARDSLGNPLECLSAAETTDQCRVPISPLHDVDAYYRTAAATSEAIHSITLNDVMCPAWPVCDPMLGRIPVWRDGVHFHPRALVRKRDAIWEKLTATGAFEPAS